MNSSSRSVALAFAAALLMAMPARGADNPADPGEQIKQGFIGVGHGIRDGAIKAWGAVKSAFDGDGSGTSSEKKATRKKSAEGSEQK